MSERLRAVTARSLNERSQRYAALGDPTRLAIVDVLARSDRTSLELQHTTRLNSNLLAYHLDVLEHAGLITRCPSSGDRRRRYVRLHRDALDELTPPAPISAQPALFICTQNSARSQLAAALWRQMTAEPAASAGTFPAARVHPGALAAGRRAGLDLSGAHPQRLSQVAVLPDLVVTVCDRAHEELQPATTWLHWSVPDPVIRASRAAFDGTVAQLRDRISALVGIPR
jgi:protein-tyrosine-phosphatase/DNA-binding MarR family transcriptional regulator